MTARAKQRVVRGAPIVRRTLAAAVDELGRVGYVDLRVEDVARRAKVNKTTVYRRWPTKEDLVRAADGTCIASLASLGADSPFAGATSGAVSLERIGGMHFPGDDEHVLTMPQGAKGWSLTAMGSFGRFLPADFISKQPGSGQMTPHGTPSGAGIELHAVTTGGGGC